MLKPAYFFPAFFLAVYLLAAPDAKSQVDSAVIKKNTAENRKLKIETADLKITDTTKKKKRSEAGKAALRSAIIPGWGQAYNKKYWKLPLVYGGLAIPVGTFVYNLNWYKKTKFAYTAKYNASLPPPLTDSSGLDKIDEQLKPLSLESIRIYRNDFRQNMDYSILAFLLVWGLNVVDATVDGHLKEFDISEDLSLKIKPHYFPLGGHSGGLSFVFTIGKNHSKTITSR